MNLRFLLDAIEIDLVKKVPEISEVLFQDAYAQLNEREFLLTIEDVARFYAREGEQVLVAPIGNPDPKSIELYLNGSVLGALFHQKARLAIHGSSFLYNDTGVLVCGASGAGKSTLTASFCKKGAHFLTDDITPIIESENELLISPISDSIKLWGDSVKKLELDDAVVSPVQNQMDKYFIKMDRDKSLHSLGSIILLSYDNSKELTVEELKGAEKFHTMLNQIYRKEYLQGMPSTQERYFALLVKLCEPTPIFAVTRPERLDYPAFLDKIESLIVKPQTNG